MLNIMIIKWIMKEIMLHKHCIESILLIANMFSTMDLPLICSTLCLSTPPAIVARWVFRHFPVNICTLLQIYTLIIHFTVTEMWKAIGNAWHCCHFHEKAGNCWKTTLLPHLQHNWPGCTFQWRCHLLPPAPGMKRWWRTPNPFITSFPRIAPPSALVSFIAFIHHPLLPSSASFSIRSEENSY